MAAGIAKLLLVSGLIVAQAGAALAAPVVNGIDSNRAALGLPVDARISSCVAPVNGTASCGAPSEASDLHDNKSQLLFVALGALAALGVGLGLSSNGGHHHGSSPVSP